MPLAGGELLLFPAAAAPASEPQRVELVPDGIAPSIVTGEFTLATNGRFEIRAKGESGESSVPLSGPITALPDRAPLIAITTPPQELIAVEGWKIPVVIEASDDVGITALRLYRGVNGWDPSSISLEVASAENGLFRATSEFDLGQLGARAGDVITYYASAEERGNPPPQSTDSSVHTIQVISEEEYREFARQEHQLADLTREFEQFRKELDRLNEQRQKAAEQLEQLLKKQASGEPLSAEDRAAMERLEKQLRDYSESTAELAKTLRERAAEMQLFDLEQQYTEELRKLAEELEQQSAQAEQTAELLKQQQNSSAEQMTRELQDSAEQFLKESGPFDSESQKSLEQLEDDLETLQKADALNEIVERLQAATSQQRALANRMAELAGRSSLTPAEQARADRFAKEQELLAEEIESITKDLDQAARDAEESLPQMAESARQLGEMLKQLAVPEEQHSAAQQAREQQGDAALQHAENAARKLESLTQAGNELQQSPGLEEGLDGPLRLAQQNARNTLQQLRRARKPSGMGPRGRGGRPSSPGQSSGADGEGDSSQAGSPGTSRENCVPASRLGSRLRDLSFSARNRKSSWNRLPNLRRFRRKPRACRFIRVSLETHRRPSR